MIYVFDTNAISDVIKKNLPVVARLREYQKDNVLCLCTPIHYEIRRGLLAISATTQMRVYEKQVRPLFSWTPLVDDDWEQAAQFWADVDCLLAALAVRLNASIVSADADFDTLPVKREDWRT